MKPGGFWSYVRLDDDAEGGRISQLGRDVVDQYGLLTGESIELFLDRDRLGWGDAWRSKIDEALASAVFFIPLLTPRYFLSAECRAELQQFAQKAMELGVSELILSLLYVPIPDMDDPSPSDDLKRLAKGFQWEDWTVHRLEDRDSSKYRTAVAKLASRLVEANRAAVRSEATPELASTEQGAGAAHEEKGWLDQLADGQEALPAWGQTVTEIGREIETIGAIMETGTAEVQEVDRKGGLASARILVARRLAEKLDPPAGRIVELGSRFSSQLHSVDGALRLLIVRGAAEAQAEDDDAARQQVCIFFRAVRGLVENGTASLDQLKKMVDVLAPLETVSRDLRPSIRTLRTGLTTVSEGADLMRDWVHLMDTSPIDCSGVV